MGQMDKVSPLLRDYPLQASDRLYLSQHHRFRPAALLLWMDESPETKQGGCGNFPHERMGVQVLRKLS